MRDRGRVGSLGSLRPDLVAQLHPSRNEGIDAESLPICSPRVLWWRCQPCGYEWQARVIDRRRNSAPAPCPAGEPRESASVACCRAGALARRSWRPS